MLHHTFHIISWDHRQQPDWGDVQMALSCYDHPTITPIVTGDDQYAILISWLPVTPHEAHEAYVEWVAQRGAC